MTTFSAGSHPFRVEACLTRCGQDLSVAITGGTRPHIGAVAVATPRKSLAAAADRSATASVLCIPGHKDDTPAREAALRLATLTGHTTAVSVGLHVDQAGNEEIQQLLANFQEVLRQIEQQVVMP